MSRLITLLTLVASITSFAQEEIKMPELDNGNNVYTLNFDKDRQNSNVISAYMQGTTRKDSLRFWAEGTILIQNVMVTVLSKDKNSKIKVDIVKNHWEDCKISGYLKNGAFQEAFDTAGKYGIVVTSEKPGISFYLAVWTSGERIPDMSTLYYSASKEKSSVKQNGQITSIGNPLQADNDRGSPTNMNYLMLVIIVVLIIIALLLGLLFFKKKKGATLLLIFISLFLWQETMFGQAQSLSEAVLNSALEEYTGVKDLATYYRNLQEAGYLGRRPLDPATDNDSEPDVNPAGAPRLPSSCLPPRYRNGRIIGGPQSGSSIYGDATNDSSTITDPSENEASLRSQNDVSKGLDPLGESEISDEKALEYEAEKNRLRNEHREANQQAQETLNEQLEYENKLHQQLMDNAREVYESQIESADGNTDLIATFTASFNNQTTSLSQAHINRVRQYRTQFHEQKNRNDMALERGLKKLREHYQEGKNGDSKKDNEEVSSGAKGPGSAASDSGSQSVGGIDPDSPSEAYSNPLDPDMPSEREPGTTQGDNNPVNREACSCLEEAYYQLDRRRLNLERLRIIYAHSMKKINAGISFGDNVSGVHGVSGLAWQSQKMIILKESIPTLNKAYDDKYAEMIQALEENLLEIDRCERLLGYNNWYNHAGFIYYQFMADKYKRN